MLSDTKLFAMVAEREQLIAEINKLQAKADKRKDRILAEMDRRGIKAIENEEWRVTYTQQHRTTYDLEKFRAKLPAGLFKKITKQVLDTSKLAEMQQRGRIDVALIAECSVPAPSKPYPSVSRKP